jgi:large subunit ribosomal protein L25
MNNKLSLGAEERVVIGKQVRQLRRDGFVPANIYGRNLASVALQVESTMLQKLLAKGGNNVIELRVGSQPAIQVLVKQVQRRYLSGEAIHVDFYRIAASEKFKAQVHLQFVHIPELASSGQATVARSLNEVMVECIPADLPTSIPVDLSLLKEIGDIIRVGDLVVGPGVTILNGQSDIVAGLYQQAHVAEAEEVAEKVESSAVEPQQT